MAADTLTPIVYATAPGGDDVITVSAKNSSGTTITGTLNVRVLVTASVTLRIGG